MMHSGYLVAAIALSFQGAVKGSQGHKEILRIYNTIQPHGYKMSASDPWCAASWTAWQIMAGHSQKDVPMSASCAQLIADAKALKIWQEDESVKPKVGWGVLYDWQDDGRGNNTGAPDHVGIVYDVDDTYVYVIEGNKSNAVGKRAIKRNGRYLRGYIKPNYSSLTKPSYTPKKAYTASLPAKDVKYGDTGDEVKKLQKFLNYRINAKLAVDGSCGKATAQAILDYQNLMGLEKDGWFGTASRQSMKAQVINFNAIAYAWPKGTAASKYKKKGGSPDPDFKAAWKLYYPNTKINTGCHSFVRLVLRASGYKNFSLTWATILSYLKKNFKQIKVNYKMSQLQPGDIRVHKNSSGEYHIWVIVDIDGKLCRAEANQGGSNERYAHITTSTSGNTKKHRADWLFRAK